VTQTTSTDGLYKPGARNNEVDGGLRAVTGTSRTLHSINSATAGNEFWNGNRRAASGATAGEGLFEQLADDIGANGQGDVDVFITSRGIRRRLADTYQSTKRFNDAKAVDIHGGYSAIMVNEIPVVSDDDVPRGLGVRAPRGRVQVGAGRRPRLARVAQGRHGVPAVGRLDARAAEGRLAGLVRLVRESHLGGSEPHGRDPDAADDVGV
jgi:hypothetical protein